MEHRKKPSSLPWIALATLVGLSGFSGARAEDGGVEVRNAVTRLDAGVWYLEARVAYRLNKNSMDALQSGIPLTFELSVEVTQDRTWLPDKEVAVLRQQAELSWQPLTRGYLVRHKNGGDQRTHATLFAALNDLGRISNLPMVDAALLQDEELYTVSLRARLDAQQLPGTLRMLDFWSDDFTLDSEWLRGPLGGEAVP